MNWRIWLIITELLFGLCEASHGQCPGGVCPTPPIYGQQLVPVPKQSTAPAQVVRIYNQQGNGQSIGSGTLVEKNDQHGLILSCAHLFTDGAGNVTVVFPDGKRYGAKVLEADKTADLSALLIRAPEAEPWEIADRAPQRGEPIYSAGYGEQGQYAVNAGTVKGYVGWGSDRMDALSITGSARQGDSGGPMFDRNHVVVGVLCGTSGTEVDGPCCLRIRKFLQRHCNRFGKPATQPQPKPPLIVDNPPAKGGDGCQCESGGCKCDPSKLTGPPGPPGRDGKDGKDAGGIDDVIVRELKLADQRNAEAIEAVKRQQELDGKKLTDFDGKLKAAILKQQELALLIQRANGRIDGIEAKMSGHLTFRLLYDPATGKLSPVK